jgi:hypothetical protein
MTVANGRSILVVVLGAMLGPAATEARAQTPTPPSAREVANQANNPAAPLTQIQLRDILLPAIEGAHGAANALEIQPVLPIGPFKSMPLVQLVKVTLPVVVTLPDPVSRTGLGDLELFDLITIKQSWGRWGFGPALTFPTASDTAFGQGKWQAGPAGAVIYTGVPNLTVGAVFQNQISYAGSPDRSDVNELAITPTLTFNLEKGWFAGLSDYDWTFDWKDGGAATFPIGLQIGRVVHVGRQPIAMSIEFGGNAAQPDTRPRAGWILGFEFSPIFNFHVGPGQKIRLRRP